MRHSKRWTPGDSGAVVTVAPGATAVAPKAPPGNPAHSATGVSPSTSLRAWMQPPPKVATSVKVWSSPPRLWACSLPPASGLSWPGAKRQAGARPWASSWPMNAEKVVAPSLVQVPGPIAALKVAGFLSPFSQGCVVGAASRRVRRLGAASDAFPSLPIRAACLTATHERHVVPCARLPPVEPCSRRRVQAC
jgi:hypothetical protein